MQVKLTKRNVEAVRPAGGRVLLMDSELRGFGCRISADGSRTYFLKYSFRNRARWVTIGRHGEMTADQARQEATRLRGVIAHGEDPAGQRADWRTAPTFAEFAERYLREYAEPHKKPRSVEEDTRNLKKHVVPALGSLRVSEVTRADIHRLHQAMRAAPTAANRCRALLSTMMNLAERWGMRPEGTNPCRHIDKYAERKRECVLSNEDVARLGRTLKEAGAAGTHPSVIAGVRLLMLTGCRLGEIQTLKWEDIDLGRRNIRLPDSKTGPRTIPLGQAAVDLLAELPRVEGNPYVLPGAKRGSYYVGMKKAWDRIRRRAGLATLRLHDLRHHFASTGAANGESLLVLGKVLGHSNPGMTARYAHLGDDPVRAATDRISARISSDLK